MALTEAQRTRFGPVLARKELREVEKMVNKRLELPRPFESARWEPQVEVSSRPEVFRDSPKLQRVFIELGFASLELFTQQEKGLAFSLPGALIGGNKLGLFISDLLVKVIGAVKLHHDTYREPHFRLIFASRDGPVGGGFVSVENGLNARDIPLEVRLDLTKVVIRIVSSEGTTDEVFLDLADLDRRLRGVISGP